jgi:replicative DNA helicase
VESRDDKVPQLSDLRESGSIEQDANAVLLCFREAYYLEKKEPREGGQALNDWQEKCSKSRRDLDVYVAKIRSGPTGRDRQTYLVEFDHIEDEAPAGGEGRP